MARAGTHVLLRHASTALLKMYGPDLTSGRSTATICITEPGAGSDVGRIVTVAKPQANVRWRLDGTKIFISYGDHDLTEQINHFVLARTSPVSAGTRGLSLFLVPKLMDDGGAPRRNGVEVERIDHKMGMKGSPTCQLRFDGAEGMLIGEENRGLNALFTMINIMRLEVAIQGVGIAERATQAAVNYALNRRQGGRADAAPEVIANHPDVRRMLLTMRTETTAMRALVLEAALQLDIASVTVGDQAQRAGHLAEFLLPICKARAAETGNKVANLAVQVFGGHGYITDNGVEQDVRDSRILSIYEGTNGIQAIDMAFRKLRDEDGVRWQVFRDGVAAELARHPASPEKRAVEDCLTRLERLVMELPQRARRSVEASASPLLELIGLTACGWMWLRMLRAPASPEQSKQHARCARWWAEQLAPMASVLEARASASAGVIDAVEPDTLAG
jgi:alkylation response protein AidB-like acyl-CoA dehydrogenase